MYEILDQDSLNMLLWAVFKVRDQAKNDCMLFKNNMNTLYECEVKYLNKYNTKVF